MELILNKEVQVTIVSEQVVSANKVEVYDIIYNNDKKKAMATLMVNGKPLRLLLWEDGEYTKAGQFEDKDVYKRIEELLTKSK